MWKTKQINITIFDNFPHFLWKTSYKHVENEFSTGNVEKYLQIFDFQ